MPLPPRRRHADDLPTHMLLRLLIDVFTLPPLFIFAATLLPFFFAAALRSAADMRQAARFKKSVRCVQARGARCRTA